MAESRHPAEVVIACTAGGNELWSDRYDGEMTNVIEMQDRIATAIVDTLRPTLLGTVTPANVQRHSDDIEAYELYLKGRFFWTQRGDALLKARDNFQRALDRDPSYALAHAGLRTRSTS